MGVFQRKPESEEGPEADAEGAEGGGLLGSLKKRGGGLMDRVAGSVKEASRSTLLKQAVDARERGNVAAAFHLAKEEYGTQPDEPDIAGFFWDVAVAYERPALAIAAVAGLIRKNAIGAHELAVQYWVELDSLVPDSIIDPSTLARLVPHLSEQVKQDDEAANGESAGGESADNEDDPEQAAARVARAARKSALRSALRGIVDERNRDALTAGLAMHVAELARDLDPASALAAARHALDCEDIHETKRERLRALISELDPDAPPPPEPELESKPALEPDTPAEAAPMGGDLESDESDSEMPGVEHPARNHPLRTESPPHGGLSDDEVEAMQRRLPPIRPGSAAAEAGDTEAGAEGDLLPFVDSGEVPLEANPEPLGAPASTVDDEATDLEPDADGELDVDILTDSAPELELDDLGNSQPELEVDVDVLAQSFPELKIASLPDAPAAENPDAGSAPVDAVPEPDIAFGDDEPDSDSDSEPERVAQPSADVSETDDVLSALDPQPEPLGAPTDAPLDPPAPETPIPAEIPIDPSMVAPMYPDLKRMPARPTGLESEAMLIEVDGGRKARIEYGVVQAIAVGEVVGLADEPVIIIDLLMDAGDNGGVPRRLVRFRSDEFDALTLIPDQSDAGEALRAFLGTLMERTSAVPLPDPDAALGLMVPCFDSVETYEQQVLQVER